jgi:hypothetical protein
VTETAGERVLRWAAEQDATKAGAASGWASGWGATPSVQHWCDAPPRKVPAMLIEGLFPAVGVGLLFGDPGDAKTATAVAFAGHAAAGCEEVFGHRITRHGPVAFLLAEGQWQFNERLAAQADALDIPHRSLPIYTHGEPIDFTSAAAVSRIIEALRPIGPVLVVVDSVVSHDSGVAGSQSDTSTQAAAFGGMNVLAQQLNCLVLALDHPGHKEKDRPAGSFAKKAKVDAGWRVKRNPKTGEVVLSVWKTKDFAVPDAFRLRLRLVGAPNGAPLVVISDGPRSPDELTRSELRGLMVVSRLNETSEAADGVTDTAWLSACLTDGLTKPTYYRAKKRLLDAGFVAKHGALHTVTESGLALVSNGLTPVSPDGVRPNPLTRPSLPGASLTHPAPLRGAGASETAPGGGLERSQNDTASLEEAA